MLAKINITHQKQILIVYAVLTIITLAVFWPVTQHEFSSEVEVTCVTGNTYVQSGITLEGIRWAFSNTWVRFWHPLTWISLMLDYQIHGLNAFGYNLTNLILHILSTLLLFRLFHRMTGDIWKSAFIAALFAIHPLRMELFTSIHRRRDFLSIFFLMLTLCLYVYYTEKPVTKRYLAVLFSFICALMSKPMVVTLPVIMILLDYWPLRRFQARKGTFIFWQLKEKILLFILSAIFSIIAIYAQYDPNISVSCPLSAKIFKASVAYLIHLQQFCLWPYDIPLIEQLSVRQVLRPILLILFISIAVIIMAKRLPYLFVGWSWFIITLLPVIGIVKCGYTHIILPHYSYLPSIGIIIMLAWGIPLLIPKRSFKKIILFTASISLLIFLAIITWQLSSYCKNLSTKSSTFLQVTNDNYMTHNNLGITLISTEGIICTENLLTKAIKFKLAFPKEEKLNDALDYYNRAISINPYDASAYNNRGTIYDKLGRHERAIESYNQAISLKPDYSIAYSNRSIACHMQDFKGKFCSKDQSSRDMDKACLLGNCKILKFAKIVEFCMKKEDASLFKNRGIDYSKLIRYQITIDDIINQAIKLNPENANDFNNRGIEYSKRGLHKIAIYDFNQTILLKPDFADAYENRGITYSKNGQYQLAIDDFNKAIRLKPDFAYYYINRGATYFIIQNKELGCLDAQKACSLGNCELLEMARSKKYCR